MTRFRRALVRATGKFLVQAGYLAMGLSVVAVLLPQLPRFEAPRTLHVVVAFTLGLVVWVGGKVLDLLAELDRVQEETGDVPEA